MFESLAAERPVIVHVDDLQWAQPMLFDLLDHVADLSRVAPVLLVCTARPELLEDRPGWGGGKLNATTLLLEPLAQRESEELLDELGDDLDPDARARIVTAADGNPLFLEEMAALARERGALEVPATIKALLAARLERLDPEGRELLERGAVEGEVFHLGAVGALVSEPLAVDIDRRLTGLVRQQLIRPHPATLEGETAYRFRHLLIRDAAYEGLPKAARTVLHERLARWLETNATQLVELDELAGWHLEQAVRYTHELRQPPNPELERRAAQHLHAAGTHATRRGDLAAATNLLARAYDLASDNDRRRARIAAELADLLTEAGDLARADELLSVAEDDPDVRVSAAPTRWRWLMYTNPHEFATVVPSQLPVMLDELARAGDHRGLANAHLVAARLHFATGQTEPTVREALLAAEQARRAGDDGLRSLALLNAIGALLEGPTRVDEAAGRAQTLTAEIRQRYLTTFAQIAPMELARCRGDLHAARAIARRAFAELLDELGMALPAAMIMHRLAELEMTAGDPSAARAALLRTDSLIAATDAKSFRSSVQARLAEAEQALGSRQAAQSALELSDQLGAAEDADTAATTAAVRARLAVADGDHEAAERWAQTAVERAFTTDMPIVRANATLGLAQVLSELGRYNEATEQARAALGLYQQKGDQTGAARATVMLAKLGAAESSTEGADAAPSTTRQR